MSAEIAISPAKSVHKPRLRRKREHVRGLVLPAKAPVQRAQFAAAGHQHIDCASQLDRTAGPRHKLRQSGSLNPATGLRRSPSFLCVTLRISLRPLRLKLFPQATKTNRRATSRRPPVQSYLLYSLVSTSEEGIAVASGSGAISVPLALPFVLDPSSGSCSARLWPCARRRRG